MGSREIALEEVIEIIGDETGKRYHWFIVGIQIYSNVDEEGTIDNIRNDCFYGSGYYEIEWDFLKKIAPKMRSLVDLFFCGCKNREEFIEKAKRIEKNDKDWKKYSFDLDFEICDSQIWEISGRDTVLVEKLNKAFAPLSDTQLL